ALPPAEQHGKYLLDGEGEVPRSRAEQNGCGDEERGVVQVFVSQHLCGSPVAPGTGDRAGILGRGSGESKSRGTGASARGHVSLKAAEACQGGEGKDAAWDVARQLAILQGNGYPADNCLAKPVCVTAQCNPLTPCSIRT